jgi:TPR repeat protein
MVDEVMNRVEANDPASICLLANSYHNGLNGIQQDLTTAMELYARAADLGFSKAHCQLANIYHKGGDTKKAKIHLWQVTKWQGTTLELWRIIQETLNEL